MDPLAVEVQPTEGVSETRENAPPEPTRLRPLPPSLEFRSDGRYAGRLGILRIALLESQSSGDLAEWDPDLEPQPPANAPSSRNPARQSQLRLLPGGSEAGSPGQASEWVRQRSLNRNTSEVRADLHGGSANGSSADANGSAAMREEVEKLREELRAVKGQLEASRARERELEQQTTAAEAPAARENPCGATEGAADPRLGEQTRAQLLFGAEEEREDKAGHGTADARGGPGQGARGGGPGLAWQNLAWVNVFEQLDKDGNQGLGIGELQKALEADSSGMLLAQSEKLREMMELLQNEEKSVVRLAELQAVMAELFEKAYHKLFLSLQIHARLAELAIKHVTGADGKEPYMSEEGKHTRPFTALARMSGGERRAVAQKLLEEAVPEIVEKMAAAFADAVASEQEEEAAAKGKFKDMVLGDVSLFERGLDGLIGYPKLDLRAAISAEHASDEKFSSWNFGQERITSAKEQLEKALPGGWDEPINPFDYAGEKRLAASMEAHAMAVKAGLRKEELVILRMYTGPMFIKYNGKMRNLLRAIERHLAQGCSQDEAVQLAMDDAGDEFVTTIHVLSSGLLKLRKECPLPPDKKVYRGFSGILVPECFKKQDSRGNRGGVEFGFLSTSASKQQAIGYIKFDRGMCQLYEMNVGQVDRGASLKWISYFPDEEEVLLPPLCGLEAEGDARYEDIEVERLDANSQQMVKAKQRIMVWPVRLNVNLKGKTLEELQAMRKHIHLSIAANTLHEIHLYVAAALQSPAVAARIEAGSRTYDTLEEVEALQVSIERQCREVVEQFKQTPAAWFNDDQHYGKAVSDVLDLRSQAECMLDLWLIGGVSSAQTAKQLSLKDAAKKWLSATHARLSTAKASNNVAQQRELATKLCRTKKLFAADLDEKDMTGITPLLHWSAEGYSLAVTLLLDAGADAACVAKGRKTALHLAVEGGHRQTALSMSSYSVVREKMDSADDHGRTPAWIVAQARWTDVMQNLIEKGFDLSRPDNAGLNATHRTPAFLLAMNGHADTLQMLAEKGADISTPDKDGRSPAFVACEGNHVECLRILAVRNQGLSTPNAQNKTPACIAAEHGHVECVLLLADHAADLSTADAETGRTPAYLLAVGGHMEALRRLAEQGADMSTADKQTGRTPAYVLAHNGHAQILKILADGGHDIASPDLQGKTPAYVACEKGHLECLRFLTESSAGLSRPDIESKTPAYVAAENGHDLCLALLADSGADLWSADLEGKTPVYVAAQHDHASVVELLAQHKAPSKVDLDACDTMGWSPTWRAAASGHLQTLHVLARHGADLCRAPSSGIFEATTPMKRAQQRKHHAVVEFFREKLGLP